MYIIQYPNPFSPTCIGNVTLKTRVVMSAVDTPKSGSVRWVLISYTGFERLSSDNVALANRSRRLLIAGGGITGMRVSIISRKCDYDVILEEKIGKLGDTTTTGNFRTATGSAMDVVMAL